MLTKSNKPPVPCPHCGRDQASKFALKRHKERCNAPMYGIGGTMRDTPTGRTKKPYPYPLMHNFPRCKS